MSMAHFQQIKKVLSSSQGQDIFKDLWALRPRTSKCVLEAKDILKDSTSSTNRSERVNERHYELHHMPVKIAHSQRVAAEVFALFISRQLGLAYQILK